MHRRVTPLGTTYDEEPGEVKLVVVAHATWVVSEADATTQPATKTALIERRTVSPSTDVGGPSASRG